MMLSSNSRDFYQNALNELDPSSVTLSQLRIIQNLTEISKSRIVFIVWLETEPLNGIIHVIGDRVFEEPLKFPITPEQQDWTNSSAQVTKPLIDILQNVLSAYITNFPDDLGTVPLNDFKRVRARACFVDPPNFNKCRTSIENFLGYVSGHLIATYNLWVEKEKRSIHQALLKLVDFIYLNLGDLHETLNQICAKAAALVKAQACVLYLVTPDGDYLTGKAIGGEHQNPVDNLKMPVYGSISGQSLCTGCLIEVKDAQSNPLYYKGMEDILGRPIKNMLVFPIRDSWSRVIGVAAISNKMTGFTNFDKEVASTLSSHFGIGLMNNLAYKRNLQVHARLQECREFLIFRQTVSDEEVQSILGRKDDVDNRLSDWRWRCREVAPEAMPRLVMQMFESLGFIKSCRMKRTTLARFILLVRKNYRPVSYHNWMHAFGVANFAFAIMKSQDYVENSLITELEGVALLVALLCHDLDHRGTTNAFQTVSKSVLATLYESEGSIMERHHVSVTLHLFNYPDCNIFEELDLIAYRRVLTLIRLVILSTDLGLHLSNLPMQKAVMESYNPNLMEHRCRFLAAIASCADMNDQVKGWRNSKEAALAVYHEFFLQGDMEKQLGLIPMAMMDREKAEIPPLQIQFIYDICLPMYRMLAKISPDLEGVVLAAEENIECWKKAQIWYSRMAPETRVGLNILNEPSLEVYINRGR